MVRSSGIQRTSFGALDGGFADLLALPENLIMLEGGTLVWLLVCIIAYGLFYLGEPCDCSYIVAWQAELFKAALVNLRHKH